MDIIIAKLLAIAIQKPLFVPSSNRFRLSIGSVTVSQTYKLLNSGSVAPS